MKSRGAALLVAGGVLFGATRAHAVYTHTASAGADYIFVGCRAGHTVICDDGTLYDIESDCTLSAGISINAVGGNDTVLIVRSAVAPLCDGSTTSITALTYNGYYIDVFGGADNDTIGGGTGDHILAGGDGDDAIGSFSDLGRATGEGGADDVRAHSTNNGWEVQGGSYDDCVGIGTPDPNSLPDVFDCGSHNSQDYYMNISGFTESNCETAVASCD